MSREEHLTKLVRQGQALRQEDIDLGAKHERERIAKKLLYVMSTPNFRWDLWLTTEEDLRRFLDEGEK